MTRKKRTQKRSKVHDSISLYMHERQEGTGLDAERAKELLGWKEETDTKLFGTAFILRDNARTKIRMFNNPTNRPFRISLAKRYANEMIRGKWRLNGETIVIDEYGHVQNGQHRLVGLILASQMDNSSIEIDAIIITGIDSGKECIDTLDIGQKRSLGDVLFRNHEFTGNNYNERDTKQLSAILAGAIRLDWLRMGGKKISDAPHFPHSEALEFFSRFPEIQDSVELIHRLENGTNIDGKRISSYLPMTVAAGLHFLMTTSQTDSSVLFDDCDTDIDTSMRTKATKFWEQFALGEGERTDATLVLRNVLVRLISDSSADRDMVLGCVVNAWIAYIENREVKATKLRPKRKRHEETNRLVQIEYPYLGGLDLDPNMLVALAEPETESTSEVEEEKEESKPRKRKKTTRKQTKSTPEESKESVVA